MKIGVLIIATNKYIRFVQPLYESIRINFIPTQTVKVCCFTDQDEVPEGVIKIPVAHRPWPYSTLMRYHFFVENQNYYNDCDYIYYIDADTRVVDVGEEILGERVGTIHPGGYKEKPEEFSYERNPISTACIPVGEGEHYYFGTFWGGSTSEFLKLSQTLKENIETDLKKNFIAVWHDESHLNKYFVDNPPTVSLPPSYGYPESWDIPFKRCILALDKNHAQMRNESPFSLFRWRDNVNRGFVAAKAIYRKLFK